MHVIKMVGSLFLLFCPGGPALAQSNIAIPADLLRQFSAITPAEAGVKLWLHMMAIILLVTAAICLLCWIYVFMVSYETIHFFEQIPEKSQKQYDFPAFVFAIIGSMASCFAIVKGFENNVITRDQFIDMVEKNDIEGVRHALEQVGMDDMPSGKELLMQMQSGRQE